MHHYWCMTLALRIHILSSGFGTVAGLARRTGVERTKLTRALNGDVRLKANEQQRVVEALGLTPEEVFPQRDVPRAAVPAA